MPSPRHPRRTLLRLAALLVPAAVAVAAVIPAAPAGAAEPRFQFDQAQVLAGNLQVPWGLAFLPGGGALISERRTGRILQRGRAGGALRSVATVPGVDTGAGEGGLLGIAVSKDYARDRFVYVMFTTRSDNRVARFRLGQRSRPQVLLSGLKRASFHNGGRIAFGPDGMLYVGTGDGGVSSLAQSLSSRNGKILRLRPDGGIPADNPFRGSPVWSLGHRNVQGLAWDAQGRLWASEFGQNRLDELNLVQRGRNYGWPNVEGVGSTQGGRFTNPRVTWATSVASPSGVAIVDNTLYMAALRGQRVWEVPLDGRGGVGRPTSLAVGQFGRVRTVALAPDGSLWLMTSNRDAYGRARAGDDVLVRIPRA